MEGGRSFEDGNIGRLSVCPGGPGQGSPHRPEVPRLCGAMEHPGDVVNKAKLYDESMGQPGVLLAPKVIRCLVDYNTKMEKLLKEMQVLFYPAE